MLQKGTNFQFPRWFGISHWTEPMWTFSKHCLCIVYSNDLYRNIFTLIKIICQMYWITVTRSHFSSQRKTPVHQFIGSGAAFSLTLILRFCIKVFFFNIPKYCLNAFYFIFYELFFFDTRAWSPLILLMLLKNKHERIPKNKASAIHEVDFNIFYCKIFLLKNPHVS